MAHTNVEKWEKSGRSGLRPCDWCGCSLSDEKYIHKDCPNCNRSCYREESKFYTELGYDGYSEVKLPSGYKMVIPR